MGSPADKWAPEMAAEDPAPLVPAVTQEGPLSGQLPPPAGDAQPLWRAACPFPPVLTEARVGLEHGCPTAQGQRPKQRGARFQASLTGLCDEAHSWGPPGISSSGSGPCSPPAHFLSPTVSPQEGGGWGSHLFYLLCLPLPCARPLGGTLHKAPHLCFSTSW